MMKAIQKSYKGHKYKDKDKDNDKDKYNDKDNDKNKDRDKVPIKTNICFILEILYSFQM